MIVAALALTPVASAIAEWPRQPYDEDRDIQLDAEPRAEVLAPEPRDQVLDAGSRDHGPAEPASRHEVLDADPRREIRDAGSRDAVR